MELIYTNANYKELGILRNPTLDLEIGKYSIASNDFELSLDKDEWDSSFNYGSLFYCEGTEYGGIVKQIKVDTANDKITFKGYTFRGLLEKEYVQPPQNDAYLVLKGSANTCLNAMIDNRFDDLFVVDDLDDTSILVNYKVRDINLLEACEKVLATGNAKLYIEHKDDGLVHIKAKPIIDMSDTLQYDNNYQLDMVVETAEEQYNHVLALGQGELTERVRINLYKNVLGEWTEDESKAYCRGINRKTYKYDDTSSETRDALLENVMKKIKELETSDSLNIAFDSDNAELFDIVGAKEDITGINFKQPIQQKILKISNEDVDISYGVGTEMLPRQKNETVINSIGTKYYNNLIQKPKINGVEIVGDLTTKDLGIDGSSVDLEYANENDIDNMFYSTE